MMVQETIRESRSAWKEAAESSTQPRFPWKDHLDIPLRQFAYGKAAAGWNQEQTRTEVRFRLWSRGVAVTPYLENCIKIGVSAGYSEYRSLKGEKMEEKMEEIPEEKGEKKESVELEVKEFKDFEPLPEGAYVCSYVEYEVKQGSDGKYLLHKWEEEDTKKWVFETSSMTLSEKSKLGDIFRACGIPLKAGEKRNLDELVGKQSMLHLLIDKEKGWNVVKTHVPVKFAKGPTPSPSSSEKDKELEAFL